MFWCETVFTHKRNPSHYLLLSFLSLIWTHKIAFKIISKLLNQPSSFYNQPFTLPKEALAKLFNPPPPPGGHFHGKMIGMLVAFLGYEILILVFLGFSGKFCAERNSGILRVCSFSIASKNEKFPKSFQ